MGFNKEDRLNFQKKRKCEDEKVKLFSAENKRLCVTVLTLLTCDAFGHGRQTEEVVLPSSGESCVRSADGRKRKKREIRAEECVVTIKMNNGAERVQKGKFFADLSICLALERLRQQYLENNRHKNV